MAQPRPANRLSLLADIGGTNTRVALAEGTRLLPETIRRFRNADHADLSAVLAAYLAAEGNPDCAGACVAAAGPVRDGVATLTNLDWTIDGATIAAAARAETVAVLNDLQAQGHALGHLAEGALACVVAGRPAPEPATKLVIGIGTGFNCAPVYETPRGRFVPPAEAGHVSLPIRSADDHALMRDLEARHGFASVEEVLSGRGLAALYAWHAARADAAQGAARALDTAAIIAAAEAGAPLAVATMKSFVTLLGSVTGNLALIHLPFGGIFLVGGMARAVGPWLGALGFGDALRDKGRFGPFLEAFPVHLVDDDYAALIGCAHHLDGLIG